MLHASLRAAAGQARQAGDHVTAASLDGEAQAIEDALLDAVREGLELLEAMACYVRTGHHSKDTGEWRDGKGLITSSWLHTISRDGDPQLHVHLAVLNAVQRADGAGGRTDLIRKGPWFKSTQACSGHSPTPSQPPGIS